MQSLTLVLVLIVLTAMGFRLGRGRAVVASGGKAGVLHSLPSYYGGYVALWCALPALILVGAWLAFEPALLKALVIARLPSEAQALPAAQLSLILNEAHNLVTGEMKTASTPVTAAAADIYGSLRHSSFVLMAGVAITVLAVGLIHSLRQIVPDLRARTKVENVIKVLLLSSSTLAVFTTIGIVLSLLFESLRFFQQVPVMSFLFGLEWSPQMAMRADQVGSSGAFGAVPLFAGTLLISVIAMLVAVPFGLLSAIYMAEYAPPKLRAVAKPLLEVLAGIPTVVYGFFAVITLAPLLRDYGVTVGLNIASESALTAGLVMGVMIIPFISSLADDVITAVPDSLRQGAIGLGATRSETILQVVLPAALPGIVGGVLLAISRAIGETMIVVMAAGLSAHLTANPFESVTTVTVQIVTLLVGDQEFNSPKTLSAFALGLVLFLVTLALNAVALHVVRKYREQYD